MKKILTVIILFLLGFSYLGKAQTTTIDSLKQVLKQTTTKDTTYVAVLNKLASKLWRNKPKEAQKYITSSLSLANNIQFKKGYYDALYLETLILYFSGGYENAIKNLKKSEIYFKKSNNIKMLIRGYNVLGLIAIEQNNIPLGIEYYLECAKSSKEINDLTSEALAYLNIGTANMRLSRYSIGLEYELKSLEIFEKTKNNLQIAHIYGNIGIVFFRQKNYPKALSYQLKALELRESISNTPGIAKSYTNIGNIFLEKKEYNKALDNYNKALDIVKKIKAVHSIPINIANIAATYTEMKKYKLSNKYFLEALEINTKMKNNAGIAINYFSMAQNYRNMKKYREALSLIKKSLTLEITTGNVYMINSAYKEQALIYQKLKLYNKAFLSLKKHVDIGDSLFTKEKNKQILDTEAIYQTAKKDQEIKLQNQTIANQKLEKERTYYIIGFLVLITILIVFFFVYRAKVIKEEAAKELELEISYKRQVFETLIEAQDEQNELLILKAELNEESEEIKTVFEHTLALKTAAENDNDTPEKLDFEALKEMRAGVISNLKGIVGTLDEILNKVGRHLQKSTKANEELSKNLFEGVFDLETEKGRNTFLNFFRKKNLGIMEKLEREYKKLSPTDTLIFMLLYIGLNRNQIIGHLYPDASDKKAPNKEAAKKAFQHFNKNIDLKSFNKSIGLESSNDSEQWLRNFKK